jgi:hypothetical protein
MNWNRILSGLLAVFYTVGAYRHAGVELAWKVAIGVIFPLACIWFADAMGDYIGSTSKRCHYDSDPRLARLRRRLVGVAFAAHHWDCVRIISYRSLTIRCSQPRKRSGIAVPEPCRYRVKTATEANMRVKAIRVLLMSPAIWLPVAVFADSGGSAESGPLWQTFLVNGLPYAIFVALLYFIFVRRIKAAVPRQDQHQTRQQQHWERVEALLERLVVALERKDKP